MKNGNGTIKKSLPAEKIQWKVKSQIQKHLSQGKSKLIWLERQIMDEKNRQKLKAEFEKTKEKLVKLKKKFDHYEEKAVLYTEKNPKKALAMAIAAGILAGTLWNSFHKKKQFTLRRADQSKTKRIELNQGRKKHGD